MSTDAKEEMGIFVVGLVTLKEESTVIFFIKFQTTFFIYVQVTFKEDFFKVQLTLNVENIFSPISSNDIGRGN